MGDHSVIVGSCLPKNDALWKYLRNLELYTLELKLIILKEVDSEVFYKYERPGVMVLISGDSSYGHVSRRALKRRQTVEILFWKNGNEILLFYNHE